MADSEVELANGVIEEIIEEERAAAIRRYRRATAIEARASRKLDSVFLPAIRKLLKDDRYDAAKMLVNTMPDSVPKVFAIDALRQYRTKGERNG